MRKAIITGITGQDGAYLASYLLEKGYKVYGCFRRTSSLNFWRLDFLKIKDHDRLNLVSLDILDFSNCFKLISDIQPDEVYNLAAQSFVGVSFDQPLLTSQTTGLGAVNLLESIKLINRKIKFYQASTSEIFGNTKIPQNERTPFAPTSPYAISKLFSYWTVINYRKAYKIFAVNGILFNHEGERRGATFVTRKITRAVANYFYGNKEILYLGNLNARRDWGYANDYVKTMWLMLQQKKPSDYVISTGVSKSVKDFVNEAYNCIGVKIIWKGKGMKGKPLHYKGKLFISLRCR